MLFYLLDPVIAPALHELAELLEGDPIPRNRKMKIWVGRTMATRKKTRTKNKTGMRTRKRFRARMRTRARTRMRTSTRKRTGMRRRTRMRKRMRTRKRTGTSTKKRTGMTRRTRVSMYREYKEEDKDDPLPAAGCHPASLVTNLK